MSVGLVVALAGLVPAPVAPALSLVRAPFSHCRAPPLAAVAVGRSVLADAADASTIRVREEAAVSVRAASGKQESVLVLGWFFASQRELDAVRRLYLRNGFTE
jgi:hypothetical protein